MNNDSLTQIWKGQSKNKWLAKQQRITMVKEVKGDGNLTGTMVVGS